MVSVSISEKPEVACVVDENIDSLLPLLGYTDIGFVRVGFIVKEYDF